MQYCKRRPLKLGPVATNKKSLLAFDLGQLCSHSKPDKVGLTHSYSSEGSSALALFKHQTVLKVHHYGGGTIDPFIFAKDSFFKI
jgi:hypothetical protein